MSFSSGKQDSPLEKIDAMKLTAESSVRLKKKKVAGIPEKKTFEVVGIFYFVYEYKQIKQIPDRTLGRFG